MIFMKGANMKKRELNNNMFSEPIGAYSNGLSVPIGDKQLIVLTGQVAIDGEGKVVGENDIGVQTEYVFKKINALLEEAGASIDNIIRVVIYLVDMEDFAKVSPIRNKYLKKSRPVSTLVEVNKLTIPECRIEIEATAIL